MKKTADGFLYSPTDLIRFMGSPFASWMDRLFIEAPDKFRPDEESEEKVLYAKTGDKHEASYLEHLRKSGSDICEIEKKETASTIEKTIAAIKQGREVIYQGHLSLPPFRGFTDFLVRSKDTGSSNIQYEIWDTKLARKAKPYYLLQLCCYAEMLEAITGSRPRILRVVLGNNQIPEFRTEDFFHYYLNLKGKFVAMMADFDPAVSPPEPDPRADHGVWQSHADTFLEERDHLVRVAGISVGQIKKLNKAGVGTMAELANLKNRKIEKLNRGIVEKLTEQAFLQIETKKLRAAAKAGEVIRPLFKILPPDKNHPRFGLAGLPPASPNDVFFDMEGFPLVEGGLEYLFGATFLTANGELGFRDWWAHDAEEEKKAFEEFVDWAFARWKADPEMHIYHYAPYEVSAARRLMGRHGTREEQIDDLLRNDVFVDLYQIVRRGMRVGEPSYSIKDVEHLYRDKRFGDVKAAGQSIVFYSNWIESGEARDWKDSKLLKQIRDYNKDDCDSLHALAIWLRAKQKENGITFAGKRNSLADSNPQHEATEQKLKERAEHAAKLQEAFSAAGTRHEAGSENAKIHETLGQLIDFHRRENKPVWWRMFDRHEMTIDELKDDINCLGGCILSDVAPTPVARSFVYSFTFDPNQDCKLRDGGKIRLANDLNISLAIEGFDPEGKVAVKISKTMLDRLGGKFPATVSFIPDEYVNPSPMPESLGMIAYEWAESEKLPECLRRLFLRLPPNVPGNDPHKPLSRDGEGVKTAAVRIASNMKDSLLCIQGPPGSGKTTTASEMITALLRASKNVGITSNSHKAIINLIRASNKRLEGSLTGIKAGGDADDEIFSECPGLIHLKTGSDAAAKYRGGLIAGTAWLFSRDDMAGKLDYLFVDEAGQVSLANLAAMSRCANNIVLMGDQMQLEQPVQGSHPGESGMSALNYYLKGHATIPPNLGLFLETSFRMHPNLCQFVSEMVYEGRLLPSPENSALIVRTGKIRKHILKDAGILFCPVTHEGNTQSSEEEVNAIVEITSELLQCTFESKDGKSRPLELSDILFVAPYNMQVRQLKEALPVGAKVGSVDKFQGQEAAVVIASLCTSAGEESPRGLEFLLDKNRINVALSRAQALAVVVGDPRIASSSCSSVADMQRLNLFSRLMLQTKSL